MHPIAPDIASWYDELKVVRVAVARSMHTQGAHPIESWLGPNQLRSCGLQTYNHGLNGTMCSAHMPLSKIWAATVVPMQPYTFGSMVFDQVRDTRACISKRLSHTPERQSGVAG